MKCLIPWFQMPKKSALFKTRVSLEQELNALLEANIEHQKITNIKFHRVLLMSS